MASRQGWNEKEKLDVFILSLRKDAIDFFGTPKSKVSNFDWLKEKFSQQIEIKDPPPTVRIKLFQVAQSEGEPLERYVTMETNG
jgi:hypothetical protein